MKSFLSLSVLLLGVAVNAAPAAQGSFGLGTTTTTTTIKPTDSTNSTTTTTLSVGSHPVAPLATSNINKRSLGDDSDSTTTTTTTTSGPFVHNFKTPSSSIESNETSAEDPKFGSSSSTSGSSFHPLSSSISRPARDTFNPSVTTHDTTTTPKVTTPETDDKSEENSKTPSSSRFTPSKLSSTSS